MVNFKNVFTWNISRIINGVITENVNPLLKIWYLKDIIDFSQEIGINFAFIHTFQSYLWYDDLFWNVSAIFFPINQLGDKRKPERRNGDRQCPLHVGHCLRIWRGKEKLLDKKEAPPKDKGFFLIKLIQTCEPTHPLKRDIWVTKSDFYRQFKEIFWQKGVKHGP